MARQPEKPDFIVDKFGSVKDVRHLKYARQAAPTTALKHDATSSSTGKNGRFKFRFPQISDRYLTVVIAILIMIVFGVVYGILNRNQAALVKANTYFRDADYSYNNGDNYEAISSYDKVIQMEPDNGAAYNNRGLAHYRLWHYETAIADLNKAIELLPHLDLVYSNRGAIYHRTGEYDKALTDLDEAIQRNPEYSIAYYNRGLVYSARNDYDMAIADFDMAIQFSSNDVFAPNLRSSDPGTELPEGIENLLRGVQSEADLPSAYTNRGIAYVFKGNYDMAIADFDQAIQLQPDNDLAYYNRGLAYRTKGVYDKASLDFRKALELNGDPDVRREAEVRLNEMGAKQK